jgi:tetratricopeptide (TPR) repeat protein
MSSSSPDSKAVELFQPPSLARRLFLTPLQLLFDGIWHLLYFIIGGILIGGILVNVVLSLVTTGTLGLTDPTTWAISHPILAYPTYSLGGFGFAIAIGFSSYLVHRRSHNAATGASISDAVKKEFGLSLVQQAVPTTSMIKFYRPAVYIPRHLTGGGDADAKAREALHASATRPNPSAFMGQVGLCVVGKELLGKTRLAWKALQDEHDTLGQWLFVRWPDDAPQGNELPELLASLQQHHAKVVLWLDDLSRYKDERSSALVAYLPGELANRRIPFIIIATLPDEGVVAEAGFSFHGLLDHLTLVHPAKLTMDEARALVAELTKGGDTVTLDEHFDGTPGSIVLAVARMRDEVYPRLSQEAKDILRTMKLLRSAGMRAYPLELVLRTSTKLFLPSHKDWTRDLEALRSAGFLREQVKDNGQVVLLEPSADIYLDVVVPDYSGPTPPVEEWNRLLGILTSAQDAPALVQLGNGFRALGDDESAETCYRRALDHLTRDATGQDWAIAQFGLGDILSRRAEAADRGQRRKILEDAEGAFKNVLQVVTDNDDPFVAEVNARLAGVVRLEATTTVNLTRRVKMLDQAAAESRKSLRVQRREINPAKWAETQYTLGRILITHAVLVQDASARRRMLDGAMEALAQALSVFTPERYPRQRARVQRYTGDAFRLRAASSNRQNREKLLKQAVDAYADALISPGPRAVWSQSDRAEILMAQADSAYQLGMLLTESQAQELLELAATASSEAAEAYAKLSERDQAVNACRFLSTVESVRASRADASMRVDLIDKAIQANAQVLTLLGKGGARELKAQVRLDLARLYWTRVTYGGNEPLGAVQARVVAALDYADQALDFYSRDTSSAEYKQAQKLQREANKMKASLPKETPASAPAAQADTVQQNNAATEE